MILCNLDPPKQVFFYFSIISLSSAPSIYCLLYTSDALSDHLNTAESRTKNALEAFIRQNGTSMPETDGTGHTSAAELEQGLYLFVETQVPETVSNTTAPFLLSLPMTSIDGMNWNYDVTVYPDVYKRQE